MRAATLINNFNHIRKIIRFTSMLIETKAKKFQKYKSKIQIKKIKFYVISLRRTITQKPPILPLIFNSLIQLVIVDSEVPHGNTCFGGSPLYTPHCSIPP